MTRWTQAQKKVNVRSIYKSGSHLPWFDVHNPQNTVSVPWPQQCAKWDSDCSSPPEKRNRRRQPLEEDMHPEGDRYFAEVTHLCSEEDLPGTLWGCTAEFQVWIRFTHEILQMTHKLAKSKVSEWETLSKHPALTRNAQEWDSDIPDWLHFPNEHSWAMRLTFNLRPY